MPPPPADAAAAAAAAVAAAAAAAVAASAAMELRSALRFLTDLAAGLPQPPPPEEQRLGPDGRAYRRARFAAAFGAGGWGAAPPAPPPAPAALPPALIALGSAEGRRRAADPRTLGHALLARLAPHFSAQRTPSSCGPASVAAVVGAATGRAIDEDSLLRPQPCRLLLPPEEVARRGSTLDELAAVARCWVGDGVEVERPADGGGGDAAAVSRLRDACAAALAAGHGVVANVSRGTLGQEPRYGHVSPLGAYHPPSDSFLLLDVARARYREPYWVPAPLLAAAVSGADRYAGRPRGCLIVRRGGGPAGAAPRALRVGTAVALSAAGAERVCRKARAPGEHLIPGEEGVVEELHADQRAATVRCPRGGAAAYWLHELEVRG